MSVVLHAGVATFAVYGMPDFKRKRPTPPPSIAIEFVLISDQTMDKARDELAKQEAETRRKQSSLAKAEAKAVAKADAVPLPSKVKKKAMKIAKVKPTPKPKPDISARQKMVSKIQPRNKPKAPSRLRSSRLSALLNKEIKKEEDLAKKTEDDKRKKQEALKKKIEQAQRTSLQNRLATASLRDALSEKLSGCWSYPRGAKGVEEMVVTVRIWLNSEGKLSRQPQFLDAGDLSDPSNAYFRIFAESARRAVKLCEPYDEAIKILNTGQSYIDFTFDGAEFSGGG